MEAFAQYGSDSEEDQTAITSGTTLGDVEQDDETKKDAATPVLTSFISAAAANQVKQEDSSRKRRRRWDMPQELAPDAKTMGFLPLPPLGSKSSLIHWDKDYLCNNHSAFVQPKEHIWSESQQQHLTEKLNQLHDTFLTPNLASSPTVSASSNVDTSSSSSWALHLKGQQEFHNPHFLNSVISHFGLNVLGSNIPQKDVVEEFEHNLVTLEEEARYRQQQQLQFQPPFDSKLYSGSAPSSSSSLLVQSDLERAMRGPY